MIEIASDFYVLSYRVVIRIPFSLSGTDLVVPLDPSSLGLWGSCVDACGYDLSVCRVAGFSILHGALFCQEDAGSCQEYVARGYRGQGCVEGGEECNGLPFTLSQFLYAFPTSHCHLLCHESLTHSLLMYVRSYTACVHTLL